MRSLRGALDPARLRTLLSGPNADTRTWIALGRVSDLPDGRIFLPGTGWTIDVVIVSGNLTNEEVPCRIPVTSHGTVIPPDPGALVVVLFTDGDPNVDCTIMGCLTTPDRPAPTSVNGTPITEPYATTNVIAVEPTLGVDAEYGAQVRVSSGVHAKLLGPLVSFADDAATQAYTRGNDLGTALDNLADALNTFANALATAPPAAPNGALTVASTAAAYTPFATAISAFKAAKATWQSTRIKGE